MQIVAIGILLLMSIGACNITLRLYKDTIYYLLVGRPASGITYYALNTKSVLFK